MSTDCQLVTYNMVTNSQLVTTTMATNNETPTRLRIGPPRHRYVYHRLDDVTWLCHRPSDWGAVGEKLVLKFVNGRWTAYDCVVPSNEDVLMGDGPPQGIPVFDTDENAIAAGWHDWRINWNRSALAPDWHATRLSCETAILG